MGEDSKPKSLTDDITKLFDLLKEGATYLIHFYLYFFSKTFPLDFIENLLDHHKEKSSYDFSKDGKTYIYRLFSCIFEVEKQVAAMGLQYINNYIPLPFVKHIYENFCVNNNLECTDVKLKKCKKALINSTKDTKKKQDKIRNGNEDDESVSSRPIPLFPNTPQPKTDNTVSDSPSTTSNLQKKNPTRSLKDSSRVNKFSSLIKTPDSTKNSSELFNLPQLDKNKNSQTKIVSNHDDVPGLITAQSGESSSKSGNDNNASKIIKNPIPTPALGSTDTLVNSQSNIGFSTPSSTVISSSSPRKPSKIPIKLPHGNVELPLTAPSENIRNMQNSLKSLNPDNNMKFPQEKASKVSLSKSSPSSSTISPPNKLQDILPSQANLELPFTPNFNTTPVSVESPIQDSSKSNSGSSKLISIPSSTTSTGNPVESNAVSFSDLAKIFSPPAVSKSTDDSALTPNPFAIIPPSDSGQPSSSLLNTGDLFLNRLNTSPSATTPPKPPSTEATMKGDESVAPTPKIIPPPIDSGNSLQETIDQNNKAFEKNMEDFGKSITDAFSGVANAPTSVPSSHGGQQTFCLENLESYNRILSIPIVTSGLNIAENVYERIKRTNNMLSWTLDQAEDTIKAVTHNPAIGLLETPLTTIDRAICKSLDIVECTIPSINLPPKMIYSNTKDYLTEVSTKIVKPVLKRADSVKQMGNTVLTSKYTEYAADKLDDALDVADAYIDKYFPDQEDSKHSQERDIATNSRALHTMKHVDRVSKKLQRRLTKRTLEHAKLIKEQGSEAIHVLLYVAELMVTDPKMALQKGKELWVELSKNEPENQARPRNVEELFVLIVRESARCFVHLINYSSTEITRLPRLIVKTVEGTKSVVLRNTHVLVQSIPLDELEKFLAETVKFIRQEIKSFTSQVLEQARQSEPRAPAQPITIALAIPKIEINSKAANSNSNSQIRQRHQYDHHVNAQHGHHGHDQYGNHGQKKNGANSPSRKRESSESKEN